VQCRADKAEHKSSKLNPCRLRLALLLPLLLLWLSQLLLLSLLSLLLHHPLYPWLVLLVFRTQRCQKERCCLNVACHHMFSHWEQPKASY
jgi:hypothetical protein